MIPKRSQKTPVRRKREPLNVELTVRFNFGETPEESVTVLDQQHIPMVNSVFESRDRIVRGFVGLLVKTGLAQRRVISKLLPAIRQLRQKSDIQK